MSLLGLVKQPARHDSGMIALRNFKCPVEVIVLDVTDLQYYGDTGVVEDLWSKLGMSESLSLVPGERSEHCDGRGSSFNGRVRRLRELVQ